ncbi:hypothetical protein Pf1_02743 [Flavobacterium columnare]|nr:hypothetical protein Pf1_02743 [Flavobacterium columnare]
MIFLKKIFGVKSYYFLFLPAMDEPLYTELEIIFANIRI